MGKNLRLPTFFAFGENGLSEGCRILDAKALHEALMNQRQLKKRKHIEFSFRVYQGCSQRFVNDPTSEDDLRCSQEALAIAAIWLELFSRDLLDDPTDGVGSAFDDKDEAAAVEFAVVSPHDLPRPRSSVVARHIHDDPTFFNSGKSDVSVERTTNHNDDLSE